MQQCFFIKLCIIISFGLISKFSTKISISKYVLSCSKISKKSLIINKAFFINSNSKTTNQSFSIPDNS